MDNNLDENFDESWDIKENIEEKINDSWNNVNNINPKDLELIEKYIKNIDYYKNLRLEKGNKMFQEFEKKNIQFENIIVEDIIENWEDLLLLNYNYSNQSYIINLINGIKDYGFFSPRSIQCLTIGLINRGKDLIAQAVAGNGKTAAFLIGSLTRINIKLYKPQVLILVPTHELCDQIYNVITNLTKYTNLNISMYRGGLKSSFSTSQPHVIIGCPGKIENMIRKKYLNLNHLKTLILDEGDELLKKEFKEQIKNIIENLDEKIQICLFSATYSKSILDVCSKFMNEPSYVILPDNKVITSLVSQWYLELNDESEKINAVKKLIVENEDKFIIIFFNFCFKLIKFSDYLQTNNISHTFIHGRLSSEERLENLDNFMKNKYKILLASDLAARGIDIPYVSVVINYDIPNTVETYIHRIGRAGRGHILGNSVTIIHSEEEINKLKYIIKIHSIPINKLINYKLS